MILGQLGVMLIGAGDVLIASKHSTLAVAGIGLAVSFLNPIFLSSVGVLSAVSANLAKKRGEGHNPKEYFGSILIIALILSLPVMCSLNLMEFVVPYFGYEEQLEDFICHYLKIVSLSIPGGLLFFVIKEFLQSYEKTLLATSLTIVMVVVNVLINTLLVFGFKDYSGLGVSGLAYATLIVRTAMGLLIFLFVLLDRNLGWRVEKKFIREVFKLGLPIGLANFFEIGAFAMTALLVGQFGKTQAAANNIVLTLSSCTFMIPVAIGGAVSVKIGHAHGQKNYLRVENFMKIGLRLTLFFALIGSALYTLLPQTILKLFIMENSVIEYGVKFLAWVALFQLFDSAQVVLAGILRGLEVSRITSLICILGFWLAGLPSGYLLAHRFGYEGEGFWIGLTISLFIMAICLYAAAKKKLGDLHAQG